MPATRRSAARSNDGVDIPPEGYPRDPAPADMPTTGQLPDGVSTATHLAATGLAARSGPPIDDVARLAETLSRSLVAIAEREKRADTAVTRERARIVKVLRKAADEIEGKPG